MKLLALVLLFAPLIWWAESRTALGASFQIGAQLSQPQLQQPQYYDPHHRPEYDGYVPYDHDNNYGPYHKNPYKPHPEPYYPPRPEKKFYADEYGGIHFTSRNKEEEGAENVEAVAENAGLASRTSAVDDEPAAAVAKK